MDKQIIDSVLTNYDQLQRTLTDEMDKIRIIASQYKKRKGWDGKPREWGGAGVIITSDPNRNHHHDDLFIVTEHSDLLVWLMYRLKQESRNYLDWSNKELFYTNAAKAAADYLTTTETVDEQKLLLMVLAAARKQIQNDLTNLSNHF